MPTASASPLTSVSTDSRVQPRRSVRAASSLHSSQCMPVDATACSMPSGDSRRVSNSTVMRACTTLKVRLLSPSSLASAPRSSDTSSAQSIPLTRYSIVLCMTPSESHPTSLGCASRPPGSWVLR
ncbi:MAG: hypothetical protein ABSC08_14295 [Bryobacteraceae bacterium]